MRKKLDRPGRVGLFPHALLVLARLLCAKSSPRCISRRTDAGLGTVAFDYMAK
jgi:hypothetical protein